MDKNIPIEEGIKALKKSRKGIYSESYENGIRIMQLDEDIALLEKLKEEQDSCIVDADWFATYINVLRTVTVGGHEYVLKRPLIDILGIK